MEDLEGAQEPGFDRFVFSFTIRDSVDDIINAQCWGAKSYVEKLDIITEIHDVVNEIKEIYTLTQLRTSLEIAKHQTSSAEASAGTKPLTLRGVLFATLVDFPIESHNGNGIVRKRYN
ncbi:unnamed protein product [Cyprideis torosa]|uniref:MEIOB-like N-terminal domain-containing protein n=1 Tax=Cyprideis torosa TaxID=163714 RepID=A0A7R8WHP2_9CRUS|nr:unnamed protein product [Cyprideis torosa]CAG0899579.1 unnamed protein product [Cyprideis torosa]